VTASLATLLASAVSYGFFKILVADDEARIRVRHGSIILEVANASQPWRQVGTNQRH
jgi:hypothetical protein